MAKKFSGAKNYFSKTVALFKNKFFFIGVFLTAAAVIFSFGAGAVTVSPSPSPDPVDGSNDTVSPSPSPDIFYGMDPVYGVNPLRDLIYRYGIDMSGTIWGGGSGDYSPPGPGKGNLVIIKSTQIGDSFGPGGVWKFTIPAITSPYPNTVNVDTNNQEGRGQNYIINLPPGLYNLSEDNNPEPGTFDSGGIAGAWIAPGWGWGCAFASRPNFAANTVGDLGNPEKVVIEENETTICVFSNKFVPGQETGVLEISTKFGPKPWEILNNTSIPMPPAKYFVAGQSIGEGRNLLQPGSYDITAQISDGWELVGVSCPSVIYNYSGGVTPYEPNIIYNIGDIMTGPSEAQIKNVPISQELITLCSFDYWLKESGGISPDAGYLKINKKTTDTEGYLAGDGAFHYEISPYLSLPEVVASVDITTRGTVGSSDIIPLKAGKYEIDETVPLVNGERQYWLLGGADCNVVEEYKPEDISWAEYGGVGGGTVGGVEIFPGKTTECNLTNYYGQGGPPQMVKLKIIVETSGGNGDETFQFGGGAIYPSAPTTAIKTERVQQNPETGTWTGKGEWIGEVREGEGIGGVFQKYSEGWILNTAKCDARYRPIMYGTGSGPSEGGVGFDYFAPVYPKDTVTCVFTSTKAAENVSNAGKIRILKFIAADQSGNNQTFNYATNFGQSPSLTTVWDANEFEEILNSPSSTDDVGGRAVAEWISKDLSAGPNFKITELPKEGWEIASRVYCLFGGGSGPIGSDGKFLPYVDNAWVWKGVATTCVFDNQKSGDGGGDGGGGGGEGKLIITKKTPNNTNSTTFDYAVFPSPSGLSVTTVNGTGVGSNVIVSLDSSIKYDIAENSLPGWTLVKATCQLPDGKGTGVLSLSGSSITGVEIIPDKTTTCVFENNFGDLPPPPPDTGKLIITKNTPGNAGTATFQYFVLPGPSMAEVRTVAGMESGSAAITGLDPNTRYSIIESSLPGWTPTKAVCQLSDGRNTGSPSANGSSVTGVEIIPGQTTACVFENNSVYIPPPPGTGKIKIIKTASGGTGRDIFYFSSNIGLSYLRTSGTASSARAEWISKPLSAGSTYKVSEIVRPQSGWTLSLVLCDKSYISMTNGVKNITVVAGQTTTCTFANKEALLSHPSRPKQ